jgi:hypothetical protein
MVGTTPRRRADLLALHLELAGYARAALRLHPRRGTPTAGDSSVGGPLAWPENEPWPTCGDDHAFDEGEPVSQEAAIEDLRRILRGDSLEAEAGLRRLDPGVTAALTRVLQGHDALAVASSQPSPLRAISAEPVGMASVLQLYRRDLPDGIAPLPEWMFPAGRATYCRCRGAPTRTRTPTSRASACTGAPTRSWAGCGTPIPR